MFEIVLTKFWMDMLAVMGSMIGLGFVISGLIHARELELDERQFVFDGVVFAMVLCLGMLITMGVISLFVGYPFPSLHVVNITIV